MYIAVCTRRKFFKVHCPHDICGVLNSLLNALNLHSKSTILDDLHLVGILRCLCLIQSSTNKFARSLCPAP